jgi:hypothetical protein
MTRTTVTPPPAELIGRIEADPDFPRGYYARALLSGEQAISGADLKGKASKYSGSYARIRNRVLAVCRKYGVTDAYDANKHGRRVLTMVQS